MSSDRPDEIDATIQQVAEWLLQDLAASPQAPEICERFGLTEYRLKTGFVARFGLRPGAWIRQQRLRVAASRLAGSDETIAAIAESVGFRNPSRFAEAFRQAYGTGPADYRLQHAPPPAAGPAGTAPDSS